MITVQREVHIWTVGSWSEKDKGEMKTQMEQRMDETGDKGAEGKLGKEVFLNLKCHYIIRQLELVGCLCIFIPNNIRSCHCKVLHDTD